jgi:Family of unknown function (DUF6498)
LYDCKRNKMAEDEPAGKLISSVLVRKGGSWKDFFRCLFTQPSYIIIIISNLAVLFIPGLDLKNNAITFLWIYMVQSLMIGVVHIVKLNLYRFALPSEPNQPKNRIFISLFFMVHYGFFHFVYSFFIPPFKVDWTVVVIGAAIFMANLIWNTIKHFQKENSGSYTAVDFMFLPYVRIIPIHIAIILGGFVGAITGSFAAVFVILAVLKTAGVVSGIPAISGYVFF